MISGILIGVAGAYLFSSGMMAIIISLDLIQSPLLEQTENDHWGSENSPIKLILVATRRPSLAICRNFRFTDIALAKDSDLLIEIGKNLHLIEYFIPWNLISSWYFICFYWQ